MADTPPDGSVIVTADATYWSADETQWPSADGGVLGNIVWAEIVEPGHGARAGFDRFCVTFSLPVGGRTKGCDGA